MKHKRINISKLLFGVFIFFAISNQSFSVAVKARSTIDLNHNWKFMMSDIAGAQMPGYNSDNWNDVSLPHDWSFQAGISKDGAQSDKGGYFGGGIAWYRKTLDIPVD